jgi:hypothetical protein
MAHDRTGGISSLSSEEAVETYRDPLLQQSITSSTQLSLEALLIRAGGIIESFAAHKKRVYEYQGKTINLDRILTAMPHHAERAGGERAKRYVLSAPALMPTNPLTSSSRSRLLGLPIFCMFVCGSLTLS